MIWSRMDGYGVERIDMELKDWGWIWMDMS